MTKKLVITAFLFVCLLMSTHQQLPAGEQVKGAFYFLAIHNEPFHRDGGEAMMEESYGVLQRMVERADRYHIKLTLMLSPQWVDFLRSRPDRMDVFRKWKASGHEIAAHHHSIYHGNWDGYTDYTKEEALREREKHTRIPEEYLGTLNDYIRKLKTLNHAIKSGCLNDEYDKKCLPDAIVYDTGSGFANFGKPGTRQNDGDPEKGKNEFITTGKVRGIERKWLCHFQTTTVERQHEAQSVFSSMKSGVYGSVNHSSPREEQAFNAWIDYLHSHDPQGKRSRTLTEVIEAKVLPEVSLSEEVLTQKGGMRPERADSAGKGGIRKGRADSRDNSRMRPERAQSAERATSAELRETVGQLKKLIEEKRAEGADISRAVELDSKSRQAFQAGKTEECMKLLRQAIQSLGS